MMPQSRQRTFVITTFSVALLFVLLAFVFLKQRGPSEPEVILWSDLRSYSGSEKLDDVGRLGVDLREVILDEVNFENVPFEKCLEHIEEKLADDAPQLDPISFQIGDEISPTTPITLRLSKVPVLEVLRYLGILNSARFDFEPGRTVVFVDPFRDPARFLEEGWFRVPLGFFQDVDPRAESVGVRGQLEEMGISLGSGETAIYFPKRQLLWASASYEQMELIDVSVASMIVCHVPGRLDRIKEWWHLRTASFRPSPPAVPVPSSPPVLFPSRGGSAPDPFGAPAPP